MGPERCLLCGEPIPEGTQVCPVCMEAERWIQCLEITGAGAVFQHEYEVFELTDQKIEEELKG